MRGDNGEHKPLRQDRLRLYRCSCRPCEQAEEILRGLAARFSAALEVVRVDRDPALGGLAGWSTPEVFLNDQRLSRYRLAERLWRTALQREGVNADDSVEGELVCLTCYLAHGHHEEKRPDCVSICVAAGSPMGILAVDGQLYAVLEDPEHRDAYDDLKKRLGSEVRVTGEVYSRGGLQAVVAHAAGGTD